MRALVTASTLALLALTPAAASAAEISSNANDKRLMFTAAAGEVNNLTVTQDGNSFIFADPGAAIGTAMDVNCSRVSVTEVRCTPGATDFRVKVDLGDLNDTVTLNTQRRADADGGAGNDALFGGAGHNSLQGGSGDDRLRGNLDSDTLAGGLGRDTADYSGSRTAVGLQPAAAADNGPHDNVAEDVEVLLGGDAADRLMAHAAGASLIGGQGDDALVGGAGPDVLEGGQGTDSFSGAGADDEIAARDEAAERVSCEDGNDHVVADRADEVAGDCERVEVPVAPAGPDAPPATVAPAGPDAPPATVAPAGPDAPPATVVEPPVTGTIGPPPVSVQAPALGKRVTVDVVSGTVRVRLPGSRAFVTLDDLTSIPTGSLLDTRRGSLSLTAASNATGKTQTATFRGGLFTVTQTKGAKPITELTMRGGNFAACRSRTASGSARTSAASKPVRSLFGSGHGRFRTRGRGSVATVRGTIWTVEDRCTGTMTTVRRGVVEVRDLTRKRTVMVRAGQRYFAARAVR